MAKRAPRPDKGVATPAPAKLGMQRKGHHLYRLGVVLDSGARSSILVNARHKGQADAIARRAGYLTTDCTMI